MDKSGLKRITGLLAILIVFSINVYGQYCVGSTKYVLRDNKGRFMKKKHLKKLKVVSVDGKKRELKKEENRFGIYYETSKGNRSHKLYFKPKLTFYFGFCNQIRDLVLRFKDVEMKLVFDIGILNSNFDISALPFKNGTFRLKDLKCANRKSPPRVDNENRGYCNVSQNSWEKVSDSVTTSEDECCGKKARFGYWYPK